MSSGEGEGPRIAIVNYGVGNLFSIRSSLSKVGARPKITRSIANLANVDAIILPGVGAFSGVMRFLSERREKLRELIESVPTLGICLGMQLLFEESEEGGKGLGIFKGKTVKLPSSVKVPHMGWNTVELERRDAILKGIPNGAYFYFVHSYAPKAESGNVIATTRYGIKFASVVRRGSVYGVQFHPEKSGVNGLRLLKNFVGIVR